MKHKIETSKFYYTSLIMGCLFILSLGIPNKTYSQCALCQAQVQTNSNEGNKQAAGLNSGILYLMATPYLIAGGLGYIWFKKYRKKEILLDMKNDPIHLN